LAAAAAASSLLGSVAHADTTWTAPADGNWSVPGNWNNGAPVGGDNVAFDAILLVGTNAVVTNITTTNNIGPLTLNSITFNSSAGIFTIGGANLLSIASGGSVSNLATRAQTIQSPLTFLGAGTINNVVGGTLTLNGNITTSSPLTFTGGGAVRLGGVGNSINTPINVNGGWVYLGNVLSGNTVVGASPHIVLSNGGRFSMNRALDGDNGNNGTNFRADVTVESGSSGRFDFMQRGHVFGAFHGDSTTTLTLGANFVRGRIQTDMSDFKGDVIVLRTPTNGTVDFAPYGIWSQTASNNIKSLHLGTGINFAGLTGQTGLFDFVVPMLTADEGATLGGNPGDVRTDSLGGGAENNLSNSDYNWIVGGTGLSGTFAGNIGNNRHHMNKVGSGTWTWTGNNTFTNRTTTISGGTLEIGNGGTTGTIGNGTGAVDNNAILAINKSNQTNISNVIGGTGSVYITGTGEIQLTAG
jgi:autotransporter-associated beta strand protein